MAAKFKVFLEAFSLTMTEFAPSYKQYESGDGKIWITNKRNNKRERAITKKQKDVIDWPEKDFCEKKEKYTSVPV